MNNVTEIKDIYDIICSASMLGNFGLFVGSGFTKAIISDSYEYQAYSWYELLEKCCETLNVDKQILKKKGSYSEIASYICKQYSINENKEYEEGILALKSTIADLTNIYPADDTVERYQGYLSTININWVVTTNYDTILEHIFIGKSLPLGPEERFIKISDLIPIYHIHGIRTSPDNIIITNEDYVSLFRPNDYRQSRLPFLIKESTVLMIGYGLGDINVITALDWSRNVYTNVCKNYESEIIQLLYKENPKDKPYRDSSGVLIVEIEDIEIFFQELNLYYQTYSTEYNEKITYLFDLTKQFVSPTDKDVDKFIDDEKHRRGLVAYLSKLSIEFSYIYPSYISFLKQVIKKLNDRAIPDGAFGAYDQKLKVLIDILEFIDLKQIPPSFFAFIANALDNVAYYVGTNRGESWAADRTWRTEKGRIPCETIDELRKFCANRLSHIYLNYLLTRY